MGRGGAMKRKRRYLSILSKMLQARQSGQEKQEEQFLEELDLIWSEMNEGDSQVINKITSLFARKIVRVDDLLRFSQASNIELIENDSRIVVTFASFSAGTQRRSRPLRQYSYRVVRTTNRYNRVKARRKSSQISYFLS
jgi:Mg2+ and Co2+ transporter CorA